ncbi:nucleoside/nucleotide kinase family protein [Sphingomonas sp. 2SG]|uniref:nucleoside/nucleotide kinase family protein n=1 Tax=Sphingomonas sp. 2SG TaxID=2502201 RepID=UPI0010F74E74|nr:nucleoside/nucleotide kinase family protein [Sphingomonas sp. 2SG]
MTEALPAPLGDAIHALLARRGRALLGVVGPPGAGKSTLADRIARQFADRSVVVPMDGFHLANAELDRLGRRDRKGAPDTFDVAGFVALLDRLRHPVAGETVYAPRFERAIEEAIAGAIPVPAGTPLVVVEGNYLLLDGPWSPVRGLLDRCCYVRTPSAQRREWLLARHMAFGRSRAEALDWIDRTDEPNAVLIERSAMRADFAVDVTSG